MFEVFRHLVKTSHKASNKSKIPRKEDIVYTPRNIAKAIIDRYKPSGSILDPCKGDGAFFDQLPNTAKWCEIALGKDFFKYEEGVDWIIGNPPYSILNQWLEHSFALGNNVVYLMPVAKVLTSLSRLESIQKYGGIVEMWVPWSGRDIGFEFGWPCGSIYFKRGYKGKTRISTSKSDEDIV